MGFHFDVMVRGRNLSLVRHCDLVGYLASRSQDLKMQENTQEIREMGAYQYI